jgi:hypothetical protein
MHMKLAILFSGLLFGFLFTSQATAQSCYEGSQTVADCCGEPSYPNEYNASGQECSQPSFAYFPCGSVGEQSCPEEVYWETCSCFGCSMSCG